MVLSKAACAAWGMTSTGSAHSAAWRGLLWCCSRNSMSTKKHDGLGDRSWFVFVHDAKGGLALAFALTLMPTAAAAQLSDVGVALSHDQYLDVPSLCCPPLAWATFGEGRWSRYVCVPSLTRKSGVLVVPTEIG